MANERKRVPKSRATGKRGARLVEDLLEAHGLVVQKVDAENDIGRDFYVDLVEDESATGLVVAIQVKSGPSHRFDGGWILPGSPSDFRLWAESSVPMFGVVVDLDLNAARWVNLTEAAGSLQVSPYPGREPAVVDGPYGKRAVVVPDINRLDMDVRPFVEAARVAVRQNQSAPALSLLGQDEFEVQAAIYDCFALGRRDYRALLLLARLLTTLPGNSCKTGVQVLARATQHPDIFWTDQNWVPTSVGVELNRHCSWSISDAAKLLEVVDEGGISRGTIGQSVFHVLHLDRQIIATLEIVAATDALSDTARLWAAAIVLYDAGEEARAVLGRMMRRSPQLVNVDNMLELGRTVQEFGYLDLF